MATAADGKAPYESGGARETSRTRPFQPEAIMWPEINEEPGDVTEEAGKNNSIGVSDLVRDSTSIFSTTGALEFKEMQKQNTFTRSKVCHLATLENLPGDLLLKIFIRLLAKQLAQMRCVSKSWNALLSHSSFVKCHLHHSIHNSDQILLVFYNNASYFDPQPPYTAHLCRSPHLELTDFFKLPPLNPIYGHTTRKIIVIGSVHGLICSRYGFDVIHIWNPSLSAVSTLPPYSGSRGDDISFQFGFDPKTEDYKVVKISSLIGLRYFVKEWLQVEVYSMRKGSWEFITQKFPSHVTSINKHNGVCVPWHDGHLHWLGSTDEEGELETMVAFDLGSETFREIPLPDVKPLIDFGVFGGKLCVMSYDEDDVCEVWVMEEYGVAESWVKRHVFSQFIGLEKLFGFTSRDEFFMEDEDRRLVLYDPNAKKAKILERHCNGVNFADKIVEYADSLVWVEPPV